MTVPFTLGYFNRTAERGSEEPLEMLGFEGRSRFSAAPPVTLTVPQTASQCFATWSALCQEGPP